MKKFYLILLVILISVISSYGQSIYVAESVTESGEPIGAKNIWEIDARGKSLFIIYDNGSPFTDDILYIFIDKFIEGSFEPFDSKVVEVDNNTSKIKIDFKFAETGQFKVYAVNEDQETLSSLMITIKTVSGPAADAAQSDNYYENISLVFSEKILVGGTPLGIVKSVSLSKYSGSIYLKLSHYAPLKTSAILVDVWRMENSSFDYDQYVESRKYKVDPTWFDTFFKYKFNKPGKYKIVIYNDFNAIIKTGYITVTR